MLRQTTLTRPLALAVLILFAAPAAANAATYFVSSDGSDQGPGSFDQPYRTIVHGADALAGGDTLIVRAGDYAEEIYGGVQGADSWLRPTLIEAFPGETVTLVPPPGAMRGFTFYAREAHYIEVRGFVIDAANVSQDAIKITNYTANSFSHHIRFRDCEVKNSPNQGILVTGDPSQQGLDVQGNEFIGLSVHDNGVTDLDHGMYVGTANNLVEGCAIYRNAGCGIQFYDGAGPTAVGNVARDNRIFDNGRVGSRGIGIGFYTGARGLMYNNLIWGNRVGIDLDYNVRDTEVYNNVAFANSVCGIHIGGFAQRSTIENNILWRNGSAMDDHGVQTIAEANLVDVDPLFADEDGHDFHLLAGSDAIDRGVTIPEVPDDFDGTLRPQGMGYDIGAYEYANPAGLGDPSDQGSSDGRLTAYPNPSRAGDRIVIALRPCGLIEILDVSGRRIRSLSHEDDGAWDGRDDEGRSVAQGIYVARVWTGEGTRSARIVILK